MSRLDDFVADLIRSGLVARSEADRVRGRLAPGPAIDAPTRLARLLIGEGLLTAYQASKLLAGATRGFVLGGYTILRPLGEGGMGKVFLADRRSDGQRVAIKVLPPRRALEDEQALKRFRREMELSRRVHHPNLTHTLDVGREGDVHFMVMEYVPGDSLHNLVQSWGPLRVPDAARYFLKVADGLAAAHDAGLVHRDIKPSNLMVTPEGDARVLDLGLARALGEESPLTRPNVVIGTLDYASPEQLRDAARADPRSDLYSLGCTLYFTLSGRAPFEGGDVVNKIFKQRMEDPDPLERAARGVPAAFAAIVRKLMAKDPADRYQSVAELRPDLARWADPKLVRAILGAEAEAARAFRPPPPQLDEEDLRLIPDDGSGPSRLSLRDLGDPEAAPAPLHRPPAPARPARVVPAGRGPDPDEVPDGDDSWLLPFAVATIGLGLLAILALIIFGP